MDKISDLVSYDPLSVTGLVWIKARQKINIGDNAGTLSIRNDGCKYWFVTINKKTYRAHRVIWELLKGNIPSGMEIDHLDGNGLNNLIENLRLVTRSVNQRNLTIRKDASSPYSGIRYRTDRDCYTAQCHNLEGLRVSKTYSCKVYGREEALNLAVKWRGSFLQDLNKRGAGYSERHIKS